MDYPKKVNIIELENAPFRCAKDAEAYAIGHGIVGCVSASGIPYRAKTTLKLHKDPKAKDNQPTKAYSYEINNIEVLKGNCRTSVRPSNKTSMIDVSILLNGVCDVNGVPLLK